MQVIQDKQSMYLALQYNQYICPPAKDPLMTSKFMAEVLSGRCWMLESNHVVTVKVCPFPPAKKKLAAILAGEMEKC